MGTECTITHIVPIAIYDSPALTATLDDFNVRPWLKLDKDFNDWIEGQDYDVYARFASDDNVPIGVRYIIVHEPQDTTASPENEYIRALKHYNFEGIPWLGNLLIFKTDWGMEITDITNEDLPLIKRLATLYVAHCSLQLSPHSHFLQPRPQKTNSTEFYLTSPVIQPNKLCCSYFERKHACNPFNSDHCLDERLQASMQTKQ